MTSVPYGLFEVYAGVLGLVVGSFLAVCIVRLPEERSLFSDSSCPHCSSPVRWRDLVPVASWVALRGRCRDCGNPVSPLYPLIEALTGVLAVLLFRRIFPSSEAFDAAHAAAYVHNFVFLCLLVVLSYVDLRYRFIPNETSSYAVGVGVVTAGIAQYFGWDGFGAVGFAWAAVGALLWFLVFAAFKFLADLVQREDAIGWGDVKLVAMFGAFLGPFPGTHMAILLGSLIGSFVGVAALVVYRQRWLPFGPSLALGAAVWVLWGPAAFGWLYPP
jgi:leader peptidase (prepilin peptidase) / N-methyltransferase